MKNFLFPRRWPKSPDGAVTANGYMSRPRATRSTVIVVPLIKSLAATSTSDVLNNACATLPFTSMRCSGEIKNSSSGRFTPKAPGPYPYGAQVRHRKQTRTAHPATANPLNFFCATVLCLNKVSWPQIFNRARPAWCLNARAGGETNHAPHFRANRISFSAPEYCDGQPTFSICRGGILSRNINNGGVPLPVSITVTVKL